MIKIEIYTKEGLVQYTSDLDIHEVLAIIDEKFPDNLGFRVVVDNKEKNMKR